MAERTKGGLLTPRAIASMDVGTWAADPAPRGEGVLQVRKLTNGQPAFYYRYTAPDGDRVRLPIGTNLPLVEARRLAAELSRRYQMGDRDLRAVLDTESRERKSSEQAAILAMEIKQARARATLGALLLAYVQQLERDKKPSANAVRAAIQRHVAGPWPALWATPAADIDTDALLTIVARVVDAGKLREAAKLRSYVRAAYAAAIRARQDARGLVSLRELRITTNPARDLVTVDGASKARDRALSVAELRAYWKRIAAWAGIDGALLRFHLLTGAQRIEQLSRLTLDDYDTDMQCLRIWDAKGRRKVARAHDVPLIPEAREAMTAIAPQRLGSYVFSVTHGQTAVGYTQLQARLAVVVAAMDDADELEKGTFTLGDLRRTVETRLAAAGVAPDVRAQLQSHGLGGVQARHYDRHDYLKEKRDALETLHRLITGKVGKVIPLKRGSR